MGIPKRVVHVRITVLFLIITVATRFLVLLVMLAIIRILNFVCT